MTEFELLKLIQFPQKADPHVHLGIGDDCSLVDIPKDHLLAISMDTLVEGTHFYPNTSPFDIGYKALMVNLSDLAAMGATPMWYTTSLTTPQLDANWAKAFIEGMNAANQTFDMTPIGGDLCRGPLSVTIQIHGIVPKGQALRRSGAQINDIIYVTGSLGDAHWALKHAKHNPSAPQALRRRLDHPTARVSLGCLLRQKATSAIDLSDGLLQDLDHMLKASEKSAILQLEHIPISDELLQQAGEGALNCALQGGDDYELCFTAPIQHQPQILAMSQQVGHRITAIGTISHGQGLWTVNQQGVKKSLMPKGYQHF